MASRSRLIVRAQHEAAGRLRDDAVAHIRETLAREAKLDVVLATFTNIQLGLRAHQHAALSPVPLVVVNPFHRLINLGDPSLMIAVDPLWDELDVFRMQEEIAAEDVAGQKVDHFGLTVCRRRIPAGCHVLQIQHDDAGRPKIELGRRVQRLIAADQIGDVALEDLRRLFRSLSQPQAVEHVLDLVGAHGADEVFKDRHGMALRAFRQSIFASITERIHDIAPIGRFIVQIDAEPLDRLVHLTHRRRDGSASPPPPSSVQLRYTSSMTSEINCVMPSNGVF